MIHFISKHHQNTFLSEKNIPMVWWLKDFFFSILTICKDDLKEDYELFRILAIMRKVGIRFVPHAKFGYVIKPIDGVWQEGEYNDVKGYLNKYQSHIVRALSEATKE